MEIRFDWVTRATVQSSPRYVKHARVVERAVNKSAHPVDHKAIPARIAIALIATSNILRILSYPSSSDLAKISEDSLRETDRYRYLTRLSFDLSLIGKQD